MSQPSREYMRKWRAANKDKCRIYCRKYYVANRERRRACGREYYWAHRTAVLKYLRKYRAAHPVDRRTAEYRAAAAAYRAANRESLRTYNTKYQRRRRAKLKAAEAGETRVGVEN